MIGDGSVPGSRDSAGIVKLDLEGDAVKVRDVITVCSEDECGNAIFSPDGQRIVFANRFVQTDTLDNGNVFRTSQTKIYLMNADRTGQHPLTDSEHQYVTPVAWSPDGTHILVRASSRNPNDTCCPDTDDEPEYLQSILLVAADGSGVTDITPFADISCATPTPWDWKQ